MNILYLSRTMGQGGAEKVVYQLAVETAGKGANVFVASCGGVYVDMMESHGIRHIQVSDLECKKPWIMLQTMWTLAETVRKEKIDIVHAHHRMAQFYAFLLKFLFPRIRIMYTAHNVFFNKISFTKMILRRTTIVSVGNNVKKNLIQVFGVDPERIHVIHNGIQIENPEERYRNETLRSIRKPGTWLIGTVGRLSDQKGMEVFVEAIADMKAEGFPVQGVIIGDGEEKDRIIKLIDDRKLHEDIILLGYQSHVPTLISQLDLVVMPSRWEGYPLLPFEVFTARKTMVASNIGGINEIVKHMENGILVQKDDVKAFSKAVMTLLNDETLRAELEENGRKTLEESNNYNDFVAQYGQLYKKLTEEQQ